MTPSELARVLTDHLVLGRTVDCELGTFFVTVVPAHSGRNPRTGALVPVPARRRARYVPADGFLSRACGPSAIARADFLAELARDVVGETSVTTREQPLTDPNDEKEVVIVPPTDVVVPIGSLGEELAQRLAARGKVSLSGIGAWRRVAWRRGKLRGRVGLELVVSPVLLAALSPR